MGRAIIGGPPLGLLLLALLSGPLSVPLYLYITIYIILI